MTSTIIPVPAAPGANGPGGGSANADPDSLVATAKKRIRHELEEEFRRLTLEERLIRVIALVTPEGKSNAELYIRTTTYQPHTGALVLRYSAAASGHSAHADDLGEAVTQLGADLLEKLETQANGLRQALDSVQLRIDAIRAGAKTAGPLVEDEDVPF